MVAAEMQLHRQKMVVETKINLKVPDTITVADS